MQDDQIADSGLMREIAQSIYPICKECRTAMKDNPPISDEDFAEMLATLEPRMSRDQVRKDDKFQQMLFDQGFE